MTMKLGLAVLAVVAAGFVPQSAAASTLCVAGAKPGCFSTVQAAVDAAADGDTIQIGPGTFAGGVTITKSVRLVGASAAATAIRGGGPVVTIGRFEADNNDLSVSLSRVTITGGLNDSQPSPSIVVGGGVSIPGSAGNVPGATVSIDDSVITGNRVTARTAIPSGGFSCSSAHAHPCAFVNGGGIDNSGALTLTNTRVSGNVAGATAGGTSLDSSADGGGIDNHAAGTLTLRHVSVTGNRAAVTPPNGAFTDGGGIVTDGVLTMEDSVVSGNSSIVDSVVPSFFPIDVEMEANAGGLRIGDVPGASATITRSRIGDNVVIGRNSAGDVQATNGGIDDDGELLLSWSSVDHNRVSASAPPASGFVAGAIDGGVQAQGAATIRNSRITDNTLTAVSVAGTANVAGAGIGSLSGSVTLERTLVMGNRGTANGANGVALGGGILNIAYFGGPPELTLTESLVTANSLAASPGITPQGGGIYSEDIFGGGPFPVTLTRTVVAGNKPDDCTGCGG
jgi:hypothetical protein